MPNTGVLPSSRGSCRSRSPAARDRRAHSKETRRRACVRALRRRGRARHTVTRQPMIAQMPGDVPLHAVVEGHDVRSPCRSLARQTSRRDRTSVAQGLSRSLHCAAAVGHDFANQVAADQAGLALALATRLASSRSTVESTPLQRSALTNAPHQGPRVDARDAHDAVLGQIFVQASHPSGNCWRCCYGCAPRSRPGAAWPLSTSSALTP